MPNVALLSHWRWLGDFGFRLVIIGVTGEVIAGVVEHVFTKHFEKFQRLWKLVGIASGAVLIIGLMMEYRGHNGETAILDAENVKLHERATKSEERTALVESNNVALEYRVEELRSTNFVLEAKVVELSNSMVKIDPRNRPTTTAEAVARFRVSSLDLNRLVIGPVSLPNLLPGTKGGPFVGFIPKGQITGTCLTLNAIEVTRSGEECLIRLAWPSATSSAETAEMMREKIGSCLMYVGYVTPAVTETGQMQVVEITGGELTLRLNTFVEKKFVFQPQTCPFSGVALLGIEAVAKTPESSVK